MPSINSNPLVTSPAFPSDDNISSEFIAIKDGKKYQIKYEIIEHNSLWKIWQATQAFFLTLLSLGIALAFEALRDKWMQAISGEEMVMTYTEIPPENLSTIKASKIGLALHPTPELPENVRNFIDAARKDIAAIPLPALKSGLYKALERGNDITSPVDKTTILTVAERIAQSYIQTNDFKKALYIRMQAAQAISPAPLLKFLQLELQREHPQLGLRLQPVDTSLFKNHTLAVQRRKYADGSTQLHLNAKLTHPVRARLQLTFDQIASNPQQLWKALPLGFCQNVTVSTETLTYQGRTSSGETKWIGHFSSDIPQNGYRLWSCQNQVIHFEGIGKVKIGNAPDNFHTYNSPSEYNHLSIELDANVSEAKATAKLNIIFAALGLGAASSTSREEDIERIKVMQLFRAFYPGKALAFERDAKSFDESVESLKTRIAKKVPEMKNKLKYYLTDHPELIYPQEVYPGYTIWAIKGLAQEVKKAGGYGLMAGIFGDDFNDATKRFMAMLKIGSLSTLDRFRTGIIAAGASTDRDIALGGAEAVFARLLTHHMPQTPSGKSYPLIGKMQVLYDLDLVERVGYAYPEDRYGTKSAYDYQRRPSIIDLAKEIELNPERHLNNEVCILNRIPPQYIKGVMVKDKNEKDLLIQAMKTEGLITRNAINQECINGIPIDQFIHSGEFKSEYWT